MAWDDWTPDCTATEGWVVDYADKASLTSNGVGITNTATQLLDTDYETSRLWVDGPTGIDGDFEFTMNLTAPAPNLTIQNLSWLGMYFTADADSYFRVKYSFDSISAGSRYVMLEFYNYFDPAAGGWEDAYKTQVDIEDSDAHDYVLKITRVGVIFRAYLDDVLIFEKLDDTEAQTFATTSIRWLYQVGVDQDDWTPENIYLTGISILHPAAAITCSYTRPYSSTTGKWFVFKSMTIS